VVLQKGVMPERQEPPEVRVVVELEDGTAPAAVRDAVSRLDGRVEHEDAGSITAVVSGGAMGALAHVSGVRAVRSGEAWDTPGRLAPGGPPEVRARLAERERNQADGQPSRDQEE
jgi:hypothetical protein